jgi:phenylpropionate dioxygenase-like ring-hydroxylating dioxygenase large terminal subunit
MDFGGDVSRKIDPAGRAYGRPKARPDEDLVLCGPGTKGGELLRRYWQPLCRSEEAGRLPKLVKILDEELILFRDGSGRPGLLYPRCMHRGTNLLYGKVEESGIRCCYHGWLFDPEGNVLEMACEPGAKPPAGSRQPWYPVEERFGLIWTYMGPPDKQPPFPRFSLAEELAEDEQITTMGGLAPSPFMKIGNAPALIGTDYNWFQLHDNLLDPFHLYWVHAHLNGVQFVDTYAILPKVTFEHTPDGVRSIQYRDLGNGRTHLRMGQSLIPNMGSITPLNDDVGFGGLFWIVPVDDTHHRTFTMSRSKAGSDPMRAMRDIAVFNSWGPNKAPGEAWTLEDFQEWQSDYVCQKGQGDISLHSEEHLSATDAGLAMLRRLWRQQAEIVAQGGDPVGAGLDEPHLYKLRAANAIVDSGTLQVVEGPDARPL